MRTLTLSVASVCAFAVGGCASTMRTSSLPQDVATLTVVDGIPYREREQLLIEVYEMGPNGYETRGQQTALLANPSVVHVQNFRGQVFANSSLKIEQRPDGSISSVALTGEGKAKDVLTNLSTGLDTLQTAKKTRDEADKARSAEAAAAEATATQAVYDAAKTAGEVRVLEFELSQMPADAPASEREAKRNEIVLAKLRANSAAVAAGQPIPYPDPNPDVEFE